MPVAAGMALAEKIRLSKHIGVVFIGDETMGEGVVYETLNIASKWSIPLLVVCEDNHYAQSTSSDRTLAGDILKRAEAFAIHTLQGTTSRPDELFLCARSAIDMVRSECKPVFFRVDTYRLNAHSKGDDDRDPVEVRQYREADPLNTFARTDRAGTRCGLRKRVPGFTARFLQRMATKCLLSINT